MRKIDVDYIKEKLIKMYGGNQSDMSRRLHVHKSYCGSGGAEMLGYITFALEGSPPKGIAIYCPGHHYLLFIDAWGKTERYDLLNDKWGDVDFDGLEDDVIIKGIKGPGR